MSTFNGIIKEFPEIRIDYFHNDPSRAAPLACFLSHIHTDHLKGLTGKYGGPFIHCSAATKDLLIKLERRQHRINLAKGIVELIDCRYKQLGRKLKVIPLETPTEVEIGLRKIRVTLFDANHCAGAVMFLIEGDGKAILYTGDIRSEAWWVEYIARHPVMIPYTSGIKLLDNMYLDTSNVVADKKLRVFPSKREGIAELLEKVFKYPSNTIFHFNAWTFGYEEVWVALAAALNSKIHLCDYRFKLFKSIAAVEKWGLGPYLGGFAFGNENVAGCLTKNPAVWVHSCEFGTDCEALRGKNVVYIRPIITRVDGRDVEEEHMEDCSGDLETHGDLWLQGDVLETILAELGEHISSDVQQLLRSASKTRKQSLPLIFNDESGSKGGSKELDIPGLLQMLAEMADNRARGLESKGKFDVDGIMLDSGEVLPKKVTFPYARHASHAELRDLVGAFRPKQVYANTVNDEEWIEGNLMQNAFGDLCSGTVFDQDDERREEYRIRMLVAEHDAKKIQSMAEESQFNLLRSDHYFRDNVLPRLSDRSPSPPIPWEYVSKRTEIPTESSISGIRTAASPVSTSRKSLTTERLLAGKEKRGLSGIPTPGSITDGIIPYTSPSKYKRGIQTLGNNRAAKYPKVGEANSSSTGENRVLEETASQTRTASLQSSHQRNCSHSSSIKISSTKKVVCSPNLPTPISRDEKLVRMISPSSSPLPVPLTDATESGSSQATNTSEMLEDEDVVEAVRAVLGVNGGSWWDLQLQSTRPKFVYPKEVEL